MCSEDFLNNAQELVQLLQQQHATTEDALQLKRDELLAATQQLNIMKGQAEASRMQIADMSRHDANVMEQYTPPSPPPPSHLLPPLPAPPFLCLCGKILVFWLTRCLRCRYTSLLINFDRNVQMYQEMYAQHQRLRDTMLASPYQRAASPSPAASSARPQASSTLDWNISSPHYRDLGVVSGCGGKFCRVVLSFGQVLTDDTGISTLAA